MAAGVQAAPAGGSWSLPSKARVRRELVARLTGDEAVAHAATALSDLNMPGWSVHPLKGNREGRHAMAISGPWRITFRWDGKDAHELDLEQYH